jgi:ubiquinol-cytochrome c reductase cytochrome b subunit
VPHAIGKDLVFAGFLILAILACAAYFGPAGPNGPPNPTLIETNPRPDFYFLPLFSAFALLPPYMETVLILVAPVVGIIILFLVPFLSNLGEKSARRRPVAVLGVIIVMLTLSVLAVARDVLAVVAGDGGVERRADADRVREEPQSRSSCRARSCCRPSSAATVHSLGGQGGMRGPALDAVATRLTPDQLVRQVLQGGGNMPAYGKNLQPAEVTALVAFMSTLRPGYERPARRRRGESERLHRRGTETQRSRRGASRTPRLRVSAVKSSE